MVVCVLACMHAVVIVVVVCVGAQVVYMVIEGSSSYHQTDI